MAKRTFLLPLMLAIFGVAHAQNEVHKLADLETQTTLAQKQLALLQAKAAIDQFKGIGGQPLPQIISLYGSAKGMRALVDLGASGVRDVRQGDVLSANMTVAKIDINTGVEVAVKGTKATFHLAMKSAPAPTSPAVGPPGAPPTPGMQAPGYPMAPGLAVPPIQPVR